MILELLGICTFGYVATHMAYKIIKYFLKHCDMEFSGATDY